MRAKILVDPGRYFLGGSSGFFIDIRGVLIRGNDPLNIMQTHPQPTPANSVFKNRAKIHRFMRLAKIMSGQNKGFGKSVKRIMLDPHGKACTDGNNVWIPLTMNPDERVNSLMQEAILAHEVAGHHRYTNFVVWEKECVKATQEGLADPMLHQFVNILEDARINHLLAQDWPGAGRMLDMAHNIMMADHKKQTTNESPLKQQAMVAMMSECIVHEAHWSERDEVIDYMDEARPILEEAIRMPNTNQVVKKAKELIEIFRRHFPEGDDPDDKNVDFTPEEIEEASKNQRKQGGRGQRANKSRFKDMEKVNPEDAPKKGSYQPPQANEDPSEGNGEGSDGEGEEDDSNEGTEGSGDAEGEGEQEGEGEGEEGSSSDSDANGDADTPPSGDSADPIGDMNYGPETGEFEESWADLIERATQDLENDYHSATRMQSTYERDMEASGMLEVESVDYSNDGHKLEVVAGLNMKKDSWSRESFDVDDIHDYSMMYDQVARENRSSIKQLVAEMERRIKGTDPSWETEKKSGKVNARSVWRAYDGTNPGVKTMFKNKTDPTEPSANVMILIDASGSMSSGVSGRKTRADFASEGAVVMSEVMNQLNFDYEIVDFNSNQGTTLRMRKTFDGALNKFSKSLIVAPFTGGNNSDGYAVEWCLNRLKTRGGNQILIVISDGQPAGHAPAGMTASEHLRSVVRDADRRVGIFGIGIAGMDCSRFYDNNTTIEDTSQLGKLSIPVLRKMLKGVIPA